MFGAIRSGFLDEATRLAASVLDGKPESRVTPRANALALLDDGWRWQRVAQAQDKDEDTIRYWHELDHQEKGVTWLALFRD